jgi:hypothetical protein
MASNFIKAGSKIQNMRQNLQNAYKISSLAGGFTIGYP